MFPAKKSQDRGMGLLIVKMLDITEHKFGGEYLSVSSSLLYIVRDIEEGEFLLNGNDDVVGRISPQPLCFASGPVRSL